MFTKGEKIYEYDYNHGRFDDHKGINITVHKVKECKEGRTFLQGDYGWSVRYEGIGKSFFGSKESLILATVKANLREAQNIDDYEDLQNLLDELRKLATKLKKLQEDKDD